MSQTTFHTVNDTGRVRSTHRQVVSLEELNFSVHETYYSYILQIIFQALFIVHCKCECVCEKKIEDVCVCVFVVRVQAYLGMPVSDVFVRVGGWRSENKFRIWFSFSTMGSIQ